MTKTKPWKIWLLIGVATYTFASPAFAAFLKKSMPYPCKANETKICVYDEQGNCISGTDTYTPGTFTYCNKGLSFCTQSTQCDVAAGTQPVTVSCCSTTP